MGRGGNESVCLLHTTALPDSKSYRRVAAIADTPSGFDLAELDLKQRHEGDILGTLQSGTKRTLKLLDLSNDREIVERTHNDAAAMVERNPQLAEELTHNLTADEQGFLEKN